MSHGIKQKNDKGKADTRAMRAKIHIAKKDLGLDDYAYRALLLRTVGAGSSKALNRNEMAKVLDEFKRLGWAPKKKARPSSPEGRKIWAIWFALADAGEVSRRGLRAYLKRMTDKQDVNFLTGDESRRVIEALKAWQKRIEKNGP